MTASTDNGRRGGGGQSSPPGLEEVAQIAAGHWPAHIPAAHDLPPATRHMLTSVEPDLLPTPMTGYSARDAATWRAQRPAGNGQTRVMVSDLRILIEEIIPSGDDPSILLPTPTVADTRDGRHVRDMSIQAMKRGASKGINLNHLFEHDDIHQFIFGDWGHQPPNDLPDATVTP